MVSSSTLTPVQSKKSVLTMDDVKLIQAQATNLRDALIIRFYSHIGCRVTEGLAVNADDVDFENRLINILVQKKHITRQCPECNKRLLKGSKRCPFCEWVGDKFEKEGKPRREYHLVPVDRGTLAMLKEYIERGGPQEVVEENQKTHKMERKLRLFNISQQQVRNVIRNCAEKAGFTELYNPKNKTFRFISTHRFRDAFATEYLKTYTSQDDLRKCADILGHSSTSTTEKYRKIAGGEAQEMVDNLFKD